MGMHDRAQGLQHAARQQTTCSCVCIQGQGNGAFVEGVQKTIASELGVGIADITNQEKKQLIRQYSKRKH